MPSRQINDFSQKGNRKNELVARPGSGHGNQGLDTGEWEEPSRGCGGYSSITLQVGLPLAIAQARQWVAQTEESSEVRGLKFLGGQSLQEVLKGEGKNGHYHFRFSKNC